MTQQEKSKERLLAEIKQADDNRSGGYYVHSDLRDKAEELVDEGEVVRLENPAGQSPLYYPKDTNNLTDERVEKLTERQSSDSSTPDFTSGGTEYDKIGADVWAYKVEGFSLNATHEAKQHIAEVEDIEYNDLKARTIQGQEHKKIVIVVDVHE